MCPGRQSEALTTQGKGRQEREMGKRGGKEEKEGRRVGKWGERRGKRIIES